MMMLLGNHHPHHLSLHDTFLSFHLFLLFPISSTKNSSSSLSLKPPKDVAHSRISFSLINGIMAHWGKTAFPNPLRRATRFFCPLVTLGIPSSQDPSLHRRGKSSPGGIPSVLPPRLRSVDLPGFLKDPLLPVLETLFLL